MSNTKLSPEQNIFGETLRRTRKERGLTLEQLSDNINISYGYIGQIERGAKQPDPLVKEKLEQWIVHGTNMPFAVTRVYEPEKKKSPTRMKIEELLDKEDEDNLEDYLFILLDRKRKIKDGN